MRPLAALVLLGLVAVARSKVSGEGALYDKLYRRGYHANLTLTHAVASVQYITGTMRKVRTVRDYGCSHGWAVETLWKHGLNASGFDISRVAAQLAEERRMHAGRRCVDALRLPQGRCFTADEAVLDAPHARGAVVLVVTLIARCRDRILDAIGAAPKKRRRLGRRGRGRCSASAPLQASWRVCLASAAARSTPCRLHSDSRRRAR